MVERERISQSGLQKILRGDEFALSLLYRELQDAFSGLLWGYFQGDRDTADDAFHRAFLDLLDDLPEFHFQGRPQFFAYFKTVLQWRCNDALRRDEAKREWERVHLMHTKLEVSDGSLEEIVELVPAPDPTDREEEYVERRMAAESALSLLRQQLGPSDLRVLEAIRELAETPGSEQLTPHQCTARLKAMTGMSGDAFYTAHARLKRKAHLVAPYLCTKRQLTKILPRGRSSR